MNNLLPLLVLGSLMSGCGSCAQPWNGGWCCGGDFRGGCFYSRGCDGVMRRCCTRCQPVCGCGWGSGWGSGCGSGCGWGSGWGSGCGCNWW